MGSGGDLAAPFDRHSLARNSALFHHERDQAPRRPLGFDPAELLRTREVAVEGADPAEPGRDRVGLGPDVVAVQWVADLEAKSVARTESDGGRAALGNPVPQPGRVLRRHHQLHTLLARVTGAVDHAGNPIDLALGEGERGRVVEPETVERARTLDS